MNKKIMLFIGMVSLVLTLISFTSAFAVSSKYWENYSLELSPGETQEVPIFLQNMAGEEDITVEGSITQGSEIAMLLGDSNVYSVPLGQKVQVNVSFTAPEEATISQKYNVLISFKVLQTSDSKSLGIGSSVEKEIPVLIVAVPKKELEISNLYIYFVILVFVLVLAFIGWKIFFKKSKRR